MSVLPMKRVLIVGMRPDRKKMLEFLQRRGVLEITDKKGAAGEEEDPLFKHIDVSGQKTTFEKNVTLATQALSVLDSVYEGKKDDGGMFAGRKVMSLSDYEDKASVQEEAMSTVYELNALSKRLSEIQADIPKYEQQLEALRPWAGFGEALDFNGTRETKAFVGTLPNEQTQQMILEQLGAQGVDADKVDISIISASTEQTCVMIVSHNKDAKEVEEALRHMSFARPAVSGGIPARMEEDTVKRLSELRKEADETREKIKTYGEKRELVKFAIDFFTLRADKYEVIGSIAQTDKVFVVNGYTTAKEAAKLENDLESRFDCVIEIEDPSPDEEVPVALKNNGFAGPVEGVVSSYSLPGKGEIDPSTVVAIFYYFLFGLMLSDAAYGLIMILGCAFILNKYRATMEAGMRKTMQMFMYCGIGTFFWGAMFGSWFGDLPLVIVRTFFNPEADFSLALWVEPTVEPMAVLGFSFVVGIIHILFGMAVSAYMSIKNGKPMDALFDVGCWYLLLIGAVGIMIGTDMIQGMFGLSFVMPPALGQVFKWMAIIGAIGVVLFTARDDKNIGLRIGKGLYGLYGITSYLSDVLSYSRLLALGLATGVISSVFNSMASMVAAPPVIGVIFFILICVIGHGLNLAINALGAYVHTNRLQYVEFFGKFYNGGGKPFTPFEEHTKYYKVTE
ncbi:MAG: V-type ATP synthase subunit I [Lachnospiraceae bacterium]|nr:V-type ATP synthase subunit I [Lachnospiraceae bacterium]